MLYYSCKSDRAKNAVKFLRTATRDAFTFRYPCGAAFTPPFIGAFVRAVRGTAVRIPCMMLALSRALPPLG